MSTAPPPLTQAELFAFWNDLAAFPATKVAPMLKHFYRVILPLLGADDGFWIVSVRLARGETARRDLCQGWRIRVSVPAVPTPERLAQIRRFLEGHDKQDPAHVGQTVVNLHRGAGRFRVLRLHGGLVDWEEFRQTEHHRLYYQERQINGRIWVAFPINDDVEICYCFDRQGPPDPARFFTPEDMDRAESLLGGLGWFHRRLVLSRGVRAGQSPLSPAEGRVLAQLLTGRSEKEVAEALGQSAHTTHTHVRAVFAKLGVQSRAELMALWL